MFVPAPPSLPFLAAAMGEDGWFEPMAPVFGVFIIGILSWQVWRAQRAYAIELAEQMRQVADEREKTNQALQQREAIITESQSKSEMLATLSREIRAHLNGIIGSADLMLDNSLAPRQRELLATLRSSAESLHRSLNDVVDYSTIETGQIQIGHVPFELRQPLIEVVESLSSLALLKGLELVLIIAPDVPSRVTGDSGRLRQILLNLMANALRSTVSGRVVLRVELPEGSSGISNQGGTWLNFSVRDTSPGIPTELQATIFDRAAPENTAPGARRISGSGLELAISKRLVELMGGQIGARSLPEGGSEFWVVLALPAEKLPPTVVSGPERLHVAVLDDLAVARVAASAILSRLGIDQDATDTVAKAAQLLHDALDAGATELVLLLDESVGRQNGPALASLIAPNSKIRGVRIVLMARNPEEVIVNGLGFPVTAVVRKPLLRSELLLDALKATPGSGVPPLRASQPPFEPAAGETRPIFQRKPHVLVVDDDDISRSVSAQRLERLGCIVDLASSGSDAVEMTQHTRFELIFMDCQMPGMDGFAATEKIRTRAGSKAPPIVALTANISDADRAKCFAAGMCDFVGKPVNKAELARVLKRWTQPDVAATQ